LGDPAQTVKHFRQNAVEQCHAQGFALKQRGEEQSRPQRIQPENHSQYQKHHLAWRCLSHGRTALLHRLLRRCGAGALVGQDTLLSRFAVGMHRSGLLSRSVFKPPAAEGTLSLKVRQAIATGCTVLHLPLSPYFCRLIYCIIPAKKQQVLDTKRPRLLPRPSVCQKTSESGKQASQSFAAAAAK